MTRFVYLFVWLDTRTCISVLGSAAVEGSFKSFVSSPTHITLTSITRKLGKVFFQVATQFCNQKVEKGNDRFGLVLQLDLAMSRGKTVQFGQLIENLFS